MTFRDFSEDPFMADFLFRLPCGSLSFTRKYLLEISPSVDLPSRRSGHNRTTSISIYFFLILIVKSSSFLKSLKIKFGDAALFLKYREGLSRGRDFIFIGWRMRAWRVISCLKRGEGGRVGFGESSLRRNGRESSSWCHVPGFICGEWINGLLFWLKSKYQ